MLQAPGEGRGIFPYLCSHDQVLTLTGPGSLIGLLAPNPLEENLEESDPQEEILLTHWTSWPSPLPLSRCLPLPAIGQSGLISHSRRISLADSGTDLISWLQERLGYN